MNITFRFSFSSYKLIISFFPSNTNSTIHTPLEISVQKETVVGISLLRITVIPPLRHLSFAGNLNGQPLSVSKVCTDKINIIINKGKNFNKKNNN